MLPTVVIILVIITTAVLVIFIEGTVFAMTIVFCKFWLSLHIHPNAFNNPDDIPLPSTLSDSHAYTP